LLIAHWRHRQLPPLISKVYEHVLGLRPHAITETSVALSADEDEGPLLVLQNRPGVSRARRGAFGLYHFAILLPDRAALGQFAAHLESLDVRLAMADHLVSEALYLRDPDGLGIEVAAYGTAQNGNEVTATDPWGTQGSHSTGALTQRRAT
jgi:catechol 2,3-dioxygenase